MKKLENDLISEINEREESDSRVGNYLTQELRNIDDEVLDMIKKGSANEKTHYDTIKQAVSDIRKELNNEIWKR